RVRLSHRIGAGELLVETVTMTVPADEEAAAKVLCEALSERGFLPPGLKLARAVHLPEDRLLADVSLTPDFTCSGALEENQVIACLAATLLNNLDTIESVRFIVDGVERETLCGHLDLLRSYSYEEVVEMMGPLGSTS
ncbi:GerMN domain-containing protein, partial [bacterium]|nr:GerMN domain-containing protein [candidate division CSSED10-310 bacterium]